MDETADALIAAYLSSNLRKSKVNVDKILEDSWKLSIDVAYADLEHKGTLSQEYVDTAIETCKRRIAEAGMAIKLGLEEIYSKLNK